MKPDIMNMTGRFLIAVPGLEDPNFKQSVVLICEHTPDGVFGLIVNKILMDRFDVIMKSLQIKSTIENIPVYYGGPVRPEQGYILYSPPDDKYGSIRLSKQLAVTNARDMLYDIAEGRGPGRFLFALGFSGWDSNQLEEEMMTDSWIEAPVDEDIIFTVPVAERWRCAASSIGLDLDRYSNSCGSA